MVREFFGANLKMNPATEEELAILLQSYIDLGVSGNENREVVVFLPDIYLGCLRGYPGLSADLKSRKIQLGVQDVSEFDSGAYTGQTSPAWVKNFGGSYDLIGHSEVRQMFENVGADRDNTNMLFNRKIRKSLEHGLNVVYCVGELGRERERGDGLLVVLGQIHLGLEGISDIDLKERVVIAYEPRWTIGEGKRPATKPQIQKVVREILKINPNYRVIYGGNMKSGNVRDIMGVRGVSGGLVGGACLDARSFSQVVNYSG